MSFSMLVNSLGWTLLHFLWQGAAIALVLAIGLRAAARSAAQVRYGMACGGLFLMAVAMPATLGWQIWGAKAVVSADSNVPRPASGGIVRTHPGAVPTSPGATADTAMERVGIGPGTLGAEVDHIKQAPAWAASGESRHAVREWMEKMAADWMPVMVGIWLAGAAVLGARLLTSWRAVRRLQRGARVLAEPRWVERVGRLAKQMEITRHVRLLVSVSAAAPMVIGLLKPAILVPASLLTALSVGQLEAIFVHELAHIRRRDYLVHHFQSFVEVFGYYHPAVWWVSAQVRAEREHCCDDIAAAHAGKLDYARALAALEAYRASRLVLAATGGPLLQRIRRVAGVPAERPRAAWPMGVLALVIAGAGLAAAIPGGMRMAGAQTEGAAKTQAAPPSATASVAASGTAGAVKVENGIETHSAIVGNAGEPSFALPDHIQVQAAEFVADGKSLVSVAYAARRVTVRTWDVAERKMTREVSLEWDDKWTAHFGRLRLSKDGTQVISILENQVGIWDAGTGKLVRRLDVPVEMREGYLRQLTCTPDMSLIACGVDSKYMLSALMSDADVVVWDGKSGRIVRTIKLQNAISAQSLSFSADGKLLATVGMGNHAQVWEAGSGKQVLDFTNSTPDRKHPDPAVTLPQVLQRVMSASLSPDGKELAVGDLLGVKLVDVATGKVRVRMDAPFRYDYGRFVFSPDGELLARFDASLTMKDPTVPVWLVKTGKLVMAMGIDPACVTFSTDGRWIAAGMTDQANAIAVWEVKAATPQTQGAALRKVDAGTLVLTAEPTASADGKVLTVTRPGKWDVGEGIVLEITEGNKYPDRLMVHWKERNDRPALRWGMDVGPLPQTPDAIHLIDRMKEGGDSLYAVAWEKDAKILWYVDEAEVRQIRFDDPAAVVDHVNARDYGIPTMPAEIKAALEKHFSIGRKADAERMKEIGGVEMLAGGEEVTSAETELPWIVKGKVVDEKGVAMAGVAVSARSVYLPMNELGAAETDAKGEYGVEFRLTMKTLNNFRGVRVVPSKAGWTERDLGAGGEFTALTSGKDAILNQLGELVHPLILNAPGTGDFVMQRAGRLEGILIREDGTPMAKGFVGVKGPAMQWSAFAVSTEADGQGRFSLDVPPGRKLQLVAGLNAGSPATVEGVSLERGEVRQVKLTVSSGGAGAGKLEMTPAAVTQGAAMKGVMLWTATLGAELGRELQWGKPAANGLRAAVTLVPRAKTYGPEAVVHRSYYIHNSGKETVTFAVEGWLQDDMAQFESLDKAGKATPIRSTFFRGATALVSVELKPNEYAQWVCSKSLNFMLQASLHSRTTAGVRVGGRLLRLQWEADEFADIMVEMERLFQTKGLL